MRGFVSISLILIYVAGAILGFTATAVTLDKLEQKGVIDLPETNPVWYAMERYAEKVEYLFAINKTKFEQDVDFERMMEGYKYETYCNNLCKLYTIQMVGHGPKIPDFCKAYCINSKKVVIQPKPKPIPVKTPENVCSKDEYLLYEPVKCTFNTKDGTITVSFNNKCYAMKFALEHSTRLGLTPEDVANVDKFVNKHCVKNENPQLPSSETPKNSKEYPPIVKKICEKYCGKVTIQPYPYITPRLPKEFSEVCREYCKNRR